MFFACCDPKKGLIRMPVGHPSRHKFTNHWSHFHRPRPFNSRVNRNYTWTAGRAQPADRAVSDELIYIVRVPITQKTRVKGLKESGELV